MTRDTLDKYRVVIITGPSGEGKSFLAMQLVKEKMMEKYNFHVVRDVSSLSNADKWHRKHVVLYDDIQDNDVDTQNIVDQLQNLLDINQSVFVIMTARKHCLLRIKARLKVNWLLQDDVIIDFSKDKLQLTDDDKRHILKAHEERFGKGNKLAKTTIDKLVSKNCPAFPNCAYLFFRNKKWFDQGIHFFERPTEVVENEIHNLKNTYCNAYLFLFYLFIKGGRLEISDIDKCKDDEKSINLLKHVLDKESTEYSSILHETLNEIDFSYVSRIESSRIITFRHDCIIEAFCRSVFKRWPQLAFSFVPLHFITKYMRMDAEKTDTEFAVIPYDRYNDLSDRFIKEFKEGHIKEVCEHEACRNFKFLSFFEEKVKQFISDLNKSTGQDSDDNKRSRFKGDLLYWSAVFGAEGILKIVIDNETFCSDFDRNWVQQQACKAVNLAKQNRITCKDEVIEKLVAIENRDRELFSIERFDEFNLFVKTKRYKKVKEKLYQRRFVVITGDSGEGKSFLAMQLVDEKISDGFIFHEVHNFNDLENTDKWLSNHIILYDDIQETETDDAQKIIDKIQKLVNKKAHIWAIMTIRSDCFQALKNKLKDDSTINISQGDLELTKRDKRNILMVHMRRFRNDEKLQDDIINKIIASHCPRFPIYVYLFVRNDDFFKQGFDFFESPTSAVEKEIESLRKSDAESYLLLFYLFLKGGRTDSKTIADIDECQKKDEKLKDLLHTVYGKEERYGAILHREIETTEYAFISRVKTSDIIAIRHDCIVEAFRKSLYKHWPKLKMEIASVHFISE